MIAVIPAIIYDLPPVADLLTDEESGPARVADMKVGKERVDAGALAHSHKPGRGAHGIIRVGSV